MSGTVCEKCGDSLKKAHAWDIVTDKHFCFPCWLSRDDKPEPPRATIEHPQCPEECRLYLPFVARAVQMEINISLNIGGPPMPSERVILRTMIKWLEALDRSYALERTLKP